MTEDEARDHVRELAKVEWAKIPFDPEPDEIIFSSKESHFCATTPPEDESGLNLCHAASAKEEAGQGLQSAKRVP